MGKLSVSVAAACAAALTVAATASPWARQSALEQRAAGFTGLAPAIVCETPFEHAQGVKAGKTGYYAFTRPARPGLIVLSPQICRELRSGDLASTDFAHAVYVLAHELGHVVSASNDETAAECYALRRWTALAASFGLAAPAPAQLDRVAAAHDRLPVRYRGGCSPAGR